MSQTTTMTVRIPLEVKDRLERLAQSTDRSKAYIAGRAIEDYLDAQQWQVDAIQGAVAEADSKKAVFLSHEEVQTRVNKKLHAAGKRK